MIIESELPLVSWDDWVERVESQYTEMPDVVLVRVGTKKKYVVMPILPRPLVDELVARAADEGTDAGALLELLPDYSDVRSPDNLLSLDVAVRKLWRFPGTPQEMLRAAFVALAVKQHHGDVARRKGSEKAGMRHDPADTQARNIQLAKHVEAMIAAGRARNLTAAYRQIAAAGGFDRLATEESIRGACVVGRRALREKRGVEE
jgi:hypothetical protein